MQGQDIVHHCRFAEIGAGNELSLLRGCGRGINQNRIPEFGPNIARLAVLEYVDNEPYLAMTSVAGLPCSAIWRGQADKSGWGYGRLALCAQRRQHRFCAWIIVS